MPLVESRVIPTFPIALSAASQVDDSIAPTSPCAADRTLEVAFADRAALADPAVTTGVNTLGIQS